MNNTLIIFDLDGTLLNTIADLGEAANQALARCGFPTHSPEAYPMFVGNGITRLIERALPETHRSESTIATVRRHFIDYYDSHLCVHTAPYPGIPEMLSALAGRGIALAVASNKYLQATRTLISHYFADIPWASVQGQREGVNLKPDPSVVFNILLEHPTPKDQVLYVGDSAIDIVTAARAGVESVGVSWGFRSVAELRNANADHIIHHPDELLKLI